MNLDSEPVHELAAMIDNIQETSEIELRMKCNDYQINRLLNNLMASKRWTRRTKESYTVHLTKDLRLRNIGKKTVATKKNVLSQNQWYVGADLEEGFVVRICHASEEVQRSRPKREVIGLRHIERYSFVYKDYIRYDISRSVHVDSTLYTQQEPSTLANEVEIELIGKNTAYNKAPVASKLYALSLLMKVRDVICMINGVPCETDLSFEKVPSK